MDEEIRIPEDGTVTSKIRYKVTTWRVSADKENFLTRNNKRDNEMATLVRLQIIIIKIIKVFKIVVSCEKIILENLTQEM